MSLPPRPLKKRDRIREIFGRSHSPLTTHLSAASARTPSRHPAVTSNGRGILNTDPVSAAASAPSTYTGNIYSDVAMRDNARVHMGNNYHTVNSSNKADLSKLKTASEATYDSSADGGPAKCLEGTRTQLLSEINNWAADPQGKRIFWLCGKAGIGKSTISRTIAEDLDEQGRLGASFFFKRGRADRSHAKLFFPTIARQLADKLPDLGHAIAAALEKDSLLCERHMTKQFDKLLLQHIAPGNTLPEDCIIVVDALDECEDVEQIEVLLKLLGRIEDVVAARVRLLVTSRPDCPLVMGFREMSDELHRDMQVDEAQMSSIKSDLRIFFDHEIAQIRSRYRRRNAFGSLSVAWVDSIDVDLLVEKSNPLFIVAFTICRLLSLSSKPREDLSMLLTEINGHGVSGELRALYLPVLRQAVPTIGRLATGDLALRFRTTIGSLILLFNPISAWSLSRLLGTSIEEVGAFIPPLRSVLDIAETMDGEPDPLGAIKLFHSSFRDFLIDPQLASDSECSVFWVDEAQGHSRIADYCLGLLSNGALKEDVFDLKAPGTRRPAVKRGTITEHLPEEVTYACVYWVQHVKKSGRRLRNDDVCHQFLKIHLLHWIEALSWLGKASDVIYNLTTLRSLVDYDEGERLSSMLDDAGRFALCNRYIIDLAPLQTYVSALIFAPSLSIIRHMFGNSLGRRFRTVPRVPEHWGAQKQILQGHESDGQESGVTTVVCSTDGKMIVSSGYDSCIRVWNAFTGEQSRTFVGHSDWVSAVDLSADGETVASVSDDETVRLWSVASGKERARLDFATVAGKKHDVNNDEPCIGAVAFSPDSSTLAAACYDTVVRIWDIKTGKVQRILEGHTHWVRTIAFSRKGDVVATGAGDGVIKLWDVSEGDEICEIQDDKTTCVNVVKISPDGNTLASGSLDGCIRFWNMKTGNLIYCLDEHDEHDCVIEDLSYSPDGKTLASTCHDNMVSLWDTSTGQEISRVRGHDDIVNSVVFLPDGKTIATASDDATIRLWDTTAVRKSQNADAHSDAVKAVAFSPDGRLLASAAHMDEFGVRLWNTASGAQVLKIPCLELDADAITFSPDGEIITQLWDNEVKRKWPIAKHDDTLRLSASSVTGEPHHGHPYALVSNDPNQHAVNHSRYSFKEDVSTSRPRVTMPSTWIKRDDEDFIWLPFEYRAVCYTTFGASIAIGRASGAVTILSLL